MILGEGRGFEIAQGRLGPGRLHHCMRAVGIGEAALALVTRRVQEREAFGATLAKSALVQAQIADAWLQLHTAWCVQRCQACIASMLFEAACVFLQQAAAVMIIMFSLPVPEPLAAGPTAQATPRHAALL